MLDQLFSTSKHWSIPEPVLYISLGIIGIAILIHCAILLARYLEERERQGNRYERLLHQYGISRAERTCLDQGCAALGIREKHRVLTDPNQFARVRDWAEKRYSRRILIKRIEEKMADPPKRPHSRAGRRKRIRPISHAV